MDTNVCCWRWAILLYSIPLLQILSEHYHALASLCSLIQSKWTIDYFPLPYWESAGFAAFRCCLPSIMHKPVISLPPSIRMHTSMPSVIRTVCTHQCHLSYVCTYQSFSLLLMHTCIDNSATLAISLCAFMRQRSKASNHITQGQPYTNKSLWLPSALALLKEWWFTLRVLRHDQLRT